MEMWTGYTKVLNLPPPSGVSGCGESTTANPGVYIIEKSAISHYSPSGGPREMSSARCVAAVSAARCRTDRSGESGSTREYTYEDLAIGNGEVGGRGRGQSSESCQAGSEMFGHHLGGSSHGTNSICLFPMEPGRCAISTSCVGEGRRLFSQHH